MRFVNLAVETLGCSLTSSRAYADGGARNPALSTQILSKTPDAPSPRDPQREPLLCRENRSSARGAGYKNEITIANRCSGQCHADGRVGEPTAGRGAGTRPSHATPEWMRKPCRTPMATMAAGVAAQTGWPREPRRTEERSIVRPDVDPAPGARTVQPDLR